MLIIKKNSFIESYYGEMFRKYLPQFGGKVTGKSLLFDIETTGFKRETSQICLIGAIRFTGAGFEVMQAAVSDLNEEPDLIFWFLELCSDSDTLIHYYGDRFDIPFIRYRASVYQRCEKMLSLLDRLTSLDLHKILKPAASLFGIRDRKQTSLEDYLGKNVITKPYFPGDMTWERCWPGGRTCVSAFLAFQKTRESRYIECVFGHNMEDLNGMLGLSVCLPVFQLKDGRFKIQKTENADSCFIWYIKTEEPIDVAFNYEFSDMKLKVDNGSATFITRKENGNLRLRYTNYKDYLYMPEEDMAVPKSIGRFLGKEVCRAAAPLQCYSWIAAEQLEKDMRQAEQFAVQNLEFLFKCCL